MCAKGNKEATQFLIQALSVHEVQDAIVQRKVNIMQKLIDNLRTPSLTEVFLKAIAN